MYYLYRHIRLDKNEPFYVGIGTVSKRNRDSITHSVYYSRAYYKHFRNRFWQNIVNKCDYEVEIMIESDDYQFIKSKEVGFIAFYGRRDLGLGPLVNTTDGGEGTNGRIVSEDTRNKMRGRRLNMSEQSRNNIREYMKNRVVSPATIEKISLSRTGKGTKKIERKIGDVVSIFSSLTEASRITGFATGSITRWVKNQRVPKDGSVWSYIL